MARYVIPQKPRRSPHESSRLFSPKEFPTLEAVLFDLDGTLIETHIDFAGMKRAVLSLAHAYGLDTTPLEALDILSAVEAARLELTDRGEPEVGKRLREAAFRTLEEIEVLQCAHPNRIPGASEVVERFRALRIPVGIVTRNSRRVSERLLAWSAIPYDTLVTRDDVPLAKPNPEHLLTALRNLGAESPEQCLIVGDHWMDILAGKRAGMRTLGIRHGRADIFAPAPPDMEVERMADLLPMLPESAPAAL